MTVNQIRLVTKPGCRKPGCRSCRSNCAKMSKDHLNIARMAISVISVLYLSLVTPQLSCVRKAWTWRPTSSYPATVARVFTTIVIFKQFWSQVLFWMQKLENSSLSSRCTSVFYKGGATDCLPYDSCRNCWIRTTLPPLEKTQLAPCPQRLLLFPALRKDLQMKVQQVRVGHQTVPLRFVFHWRSLPWKQTNI